MVTGLLLNTYPFRFVFANPMLFFWIIIVIIMFYTDMKACFIAPSHPQRQHQDPGLYLGRPGLRSQGVRDARGGEGTDLSLKPGEPVKSSLGVLLCVAVASFGFPAPPAQKKRPTVWYGVCTCQTVYLPFTSDTTGFTGETVIQRK